MFERARECLAVRMACKVRRIDIRRSKLSRSSANHHCHADETQLSTIIVIIVANTKNSPVLPSSSSSFYVHLPCSEYYRTQTIKSHIRIRQSRRPEAPSSRKTCAAIIRPVSHRRLLQTPLKALRPRATSHLRRTSRCTRSSTVCCIHRH